MKYIGMVLMVSGIIIVGWFGYQSWSGKQSVDRIDDHIVKSTDHKDRDSIPYEESPEIFKEQFDEQQTESIDYHDGDEIAQLIIPEVDLSFDVFWGTGEDALAKGVGMYESEWTTPPDHGRHTVLSGHRDSVFRPIGDLKEGDSLYIHYKDEAYEYRINDIWITDEHDRSVIVEKDEPTLTLSTCYPFQFIGSAPDRYIVQAELVSKGDLLKVS